MTARLVIRLVAYVTLTAVGAVVLGPLWWLAPLGVLLVLLAIRKLSILDDGYIEARDVRRLRREMKDL